MANSDLTDQSGNLPTGVSVTFAIKDTHKTLQLPESSFLGFPEAVPETARPSLAQQLRLDYSERMSQFSTSHLLCGLNHYLPDFESPPNDCDIHCKIYVDTRIEITQPKIIINSTKIGH